MTEIHRDPRHQVRTQTQSGTAQLQGRLWSVNAADWAIVNPFRDALSAPVG